MSALDEALALIKRWAHVGDHSVCWPYRLASFVKSGNGACTYGRVIVKGRRQRAHRATYEAFFGGIPAGLLVCHSCDNPLCCNPSHLFLGTAADNNADKVAKGRHVSYAGEENRTAKLTNLQAQEVALRARAGESQRALAKEFGISQPAVSRLKSQGGYKAQEAA